MKEEKKINNEQLKLEIAELIGEVRSGQLTINGKGGQIIIDALSLIEFLKKVIKIL